MQDALDAAEVQLETPESQEKVNAAADELTKAVDNLVSVSYTHLRGKAYEAGFPVLCLTLSSQGSSRDCAGRPFSLRTISCAASVPDS